MTRQARRIGILTLAGFITYKLTVVTFSGAIPGDPFYGFRAYDWVIWILDGAELGYILAALLIEYGLLYRVTRRLSLWRLAAWGGVLGPYFAWLLFPFDQMSKIDTLPARYWPPGLAGAILEILVFLIGVPLVIAFSLYRFRSLNRTSLTSSAA